MQPQSKYVVLVIFRSYVLQVAMHTEFVNTELLFQAKIKTQAYKLLQTCHSNFSTEPPVVLYITLFLYNTSQVLTIFCRLLIGRTYLICKLNIFFSLCFYFYLNLFILIVVMPYHLLKLMNQSALLRKDLTFP